MPNLDDFFVSPGSLPGRSNHTCIRRSIRTRSMKNTSTSFMESQRMSGVSSVASSDICRPAGPERPDWRLETEDWRLTRHAHGYHFARSPRTEIVEGGPPHAPRRACPHSARRLHRRLREPELRRSLADAFPEHLVSGCPSGDPHARTDAFDRLARHLHGAHRLALGAPPDSHPRRGRAGSRRSPDSE